MSLETYGHDAMIRKKIALNKINKLQDAGLTFLVIFNIDLFRFTLNTNHGHWTLCKIKFKNSTKAKVFDIMITSFK